MSGTLWLGDGSLDTIFGLNQIGFSNGTGSLQQPICLVQSANLQKEGKGDDCAILFVQASYLAPRL